MESNLEQLIQKSTSARESISRILLKNFPIEQEFADFLSMDIVNQAIGVDAVERYNEAKRAAKKLKEEEWERKCRQAKWDERKDSILNVARIGLTRVFPAILLLIVIGWTATGVHSCISKSPYPRTYDALLESTRFADVERGGWHSASVKGLNDSSNLCIDGWDSWGRYGLRGNAPTCINRKKVDDLNNALQ